MINEEQLNQIHEILKDNDCRHLSDALQTHMATLWIRQEAIEN